MVDALAGDAGAIGYAHLLGSNGDQESCLQVSLL